MKSNYEIRSQAREILRKGWFGRIACVAIALYSMVTLVAIIVAAAFMSMEVQTWTDFIRAKIEAAQGGLDYAVPSAEIGLSMTGASLFQQLAGYLFGAIFMFGMATVLLKAVRNDGERWFADSFGGFLRPLEVTWLIILMNMKVVLWSLLFIIPGIVAAYRYRLAWYLKSEHPEWGAGKCLKESGIMMKGRKWQAFCLDLYYGWIALLFLIFIVLGCALTTVVSRYGGSTLLSAFVGSAVSLASIWLVVYLFISLFTARAVFYMEIGLKPECPAES